MNAPFYSGLRRRPAIIDVRTSDVRRPLFNSKTRLISQQAEIEPVYHLTTLGFINLTQFSFVVYLDISI